jgi:hypothetical protein
MSQRDTLPVIAKIANESIVTKKGRRNPGNAANNPVIQANFAFLESR